MVDPVCDSDGRSYERAAIEARIRGGDTASPFTDRPMRVEELASNRALRNAIEDYQAFLTRTGGASMLAQEHAYAYHHAIASRLNTPELTPEQKAIVDQIYSDRAVPARAAAACCAFLADANLTFRSLVYKEFTQYLRPQLAYLQLGRAEGHVKEDIKRVCLNALIADPDLRTPVDLFRAARGDFARLYPRAASYEDGRIAREQDARRAEYLRL